MQRQTRRRAVTTALFALVAIALGAIAAAGLRASGDGLESRQTVVDGIPVQLIAPQGQSNGPTVVVAHGFAGSSTIMRPLAEGLARSGYTAITFDFAGHGANPAHLPYSPATLTADTTLDGNLATVVAWAAEQPEADAGRLALLGHSMGAGAVVSYASTNPVRATIALSLPSAGSLQGPVANLLLLYGSMEPEQFSEAAISAVHEAYPGAVVGRQYGSLAEGSAREAVQVPGVEHIGIVFSGPVLADSVAWLGGALEGPTSAAPASNAPLWLLLALVAGAIGVVPIARLALGRDIADADELPYPRWWLVLVGALAAAVLASLAAQLLTPITELVPLAVGGYAAAWFAVAGAALLAGVLLWHRRQPNQAIALGITARSVAGAMGIAAYAVLVLALPGARTWSSFALVGDRWWLALLLLPPFVLYFWADEMAVRGRPFWARGLLALANRLIAVAILLASTALLGAPGFLLLVLPVMLLAFILLGILAAIAARQRNGFLGAVLVQAVPLAVLVGTAFPLVS